MQNSNGEKIEITETENGEYELYSNVVGVFGYLAFVPSGSYYVYYPEFKGFLKPKHLIYIIQELNKLNKYDVFKEKMKKH